jgi:hypothetical protein
MPAQLSCEFPGCKRHFRNLSGLRKHIRTKHTHSFTRPTPVVRIASPTAFDLVDPPSSPQAHTELDGQADPDVDFNVNDPMDDPLPENSRQPFSQLHPFLNGMFVPHF